MQGGILKMWKAASSECFNPSSDTCLQQSEGGNYAGSEFFGADLKPGGPAFVPPALAQGAINDR